MKRSRSDWSWADHFGGSGRREVSPQVSIQEMEAGTKELAFCFTKWWTHYWEIPDELARQTLIEMGMAGDRRNQFAQCLFPYHPSMGSLGNWQRTVGEWVAGDIRHEVELRDRMCKLHYKPRATGYTMEQMLELTKFYIWKGKLSLPEGR